ncbi:FCD domain-containing protein [Cohnella thailandensis]|uniref:FadR family transcriptional regulator n=1 Tax=Cohnella thailandensis TaxID=557557 RepID=A0A841SZV6_9BACL|nr:FadR family transcriptional regulator [Cohnella thailandensis]MBP1973311.1 DNA-binding FadR family transcriptional regulator [Cohnella thailandensis]
MEVTPLTKRNHYEEITEQLKRQILDGKLKVGDKLPSTKEMSERFGVGRSTTREALSALKAMGLIEIRQGGGCTVIRSEPEPEIKLPELESLRLNRETLLELIEVRQSLEVSIASLAAEKRTEEDAATLQRIVKEMELAVGNDLEGERTDIEFHLALVKATHNSMLSKVLDSIMTPMELAIREVRRVELYSNRTVAERLLEEHSAICEAVAARDAAAAAEGMKRHLRNIENILLKYL